LEATRDQIQALAIDPNFYKKPEPVVKETLSKLQSLNEEIEAAYLRWEALSEADDQP